MKTIEERAKHKSELNQFRSDYIYNRHSVKEGYILGATEQKAIDIDKACEWIREYTTRIRRTNIGQGVCEFQLMHPIQVDEMLSMFRKAMEEDK